MKRTFILLACILAVLSSCKKDDSGSKFTDGLSFGTSVNYNDFTLNGEGTSFSTVPGNVAFRIESEDAYDGYSVKFVILKDRMNYSTEIFSNNPAPTGHIFITTFNYSTAGSYLVTGYIVKPDGDKSVASGSF
jgi:hypothetical protein